MLKDDKDFIAYVAEEHETERMIHGLGSFILGPNEGWIGPLYVRKKWRGQGNSIQLLLHQMYRLNQMGVSTIYTAINSQNAVSLKSYKSVGFVEIGAVDVHGDVLDDPERILYSAFRKTEII